jgi:hypothetical protein
MQEGKNDHKNIKKFRNSCFEVLDVLFRGLKATPVSSNFKFNNLFPFKIYYVHKCDNIL